jgi:muramoyltetrapeptide carboxypeptidase
MDIIKPSRLERGQTVGVIAPASPPRGDGALIPQWLDRIEALGFEVKQGEHLYDRYGYMAGFDTDRAADVNRMFADEEVDAIICLRSGYGSARTLPYLDYDLIRRNPKIIIGCSDLTALINAIHAKTGLVTFHGPEAEDELALRTYALAEFEKVVMRGLSGITLGSAPAAPLFDDGGERRDPLKRYVPGKARGRLIGGNMCTLVGLLGTPYEPDFNGKLLFLEDIGEDTYAQGRYLHQLWLAGKLQQLAGVAFGQFEEVEERVFTLHEVLAEWFIALRIPALYGLTIGHMDEQATVPLGCDAELDVDAGTLTLLEAAVV